MDDARIPPHKGLPSAAIALAILAFVVLVRAPFIFNCGVDEAFYLVIGRQWLNGLPPYAGSFDVKPPLLFLLMAAAEALIGPTLMAAKALTATAVAATASGLYLLGRRWFGEPAGFAAATLYPVTTLNLGGTFSPAELIMAAFTTFGMVIGWPALLGESRNRLVRLFAAGMLFGAAACVKQTAVFEATALTLGLAAAKYRKLLIPAAVIFAGGLAIAPAAFAVYFFARGELRFLIDDALLSAMVRARVGFLSWNEALTNLIAGMAPLLPLVLMAGVLWVERRSLRSGASYPALRLLGLWGSAALAGIVVTRAMFIIYLLPLLQPLCLAAGAFMKQILGRLGAPARRLQFQAAVMAGLICYSGFTVVPLAFAGRENFEAGQAAANSMQSAGKRPEDRILIVDWDLPLYLFAESDPSAAIFHPQQMLCGFPGGIGVALKTAIDNDPAFIVVADPPVIRVCEREASRFELKIRLATDYCVVGSFPSTITGWPGALKVFARKQSHHPCG